MNQDYLLQTNKEHQKKKLEGKFCASCEIEFQNTEEHKLHYKSDLHAFNLKRRMVELPPISLETFEQNMKIFKEQKLLQNNLKVKQQNWCENCHKNFKSKETFQQHLLSKKHQQKQKNPDQIKKESKIQALEETTIFNQNVCLFCKQKQENFDLNLEHMEKVHSFFICEKQNCINKNGIINILAEQIFKDLECIFCSYMKHREFETFQDVQKHMISSGHCMMNQDYMEAFKRFYDYSKENQMIIDKYIINGDFNYEDLEGFELVEIAGKDEKVENEEDWVSMSEEEFEDIKQSKNSEKQSGVEEFSLHTEEIPNLKFFDLRNFVLLKAKKNYLGELELPNKKVLGNKKYAIYYKQKLREPIQLLEIQKYLEDKKEIVPDSKALVEFSYDKLRGLYLKAKRFERKKLLKLEIQEKQKNDKIKFRFVHQDQKEKLKRDQRHNRILTKHFRERNILPS